MRSQRYVSDELTHFVGRPLREQYTDEKAREEKCYEMLITILRDGVLFSGETSEVGGERIRPTGRTTRWNPEADLEDMFKTNVVCFCDIPVDDLGIHMAKYSRFGLSFDRGFLLEHGANPVMYVAKNSVTSEGRNEEVYTEGARQGIQFLQETMRHPKEAGSLSGGIGFLHTFLIFNIFPFLKPFNASLADDDPANYYMEREWRRYGDLEFQLPDVRRVYLPERFAAALRADLPDYFGQVTFAR